MTIRFVCPRGHKLAVPDNLAGKKGRCPVCQQRVYIPVPEQSDAAAGPDLGEPAAAEQTSGPVGVPAALAGPFEAAMSDILAPSAPSREEPEIATAPPLVQAPPSLGGEPLGEAAAEANGQLAESRPGPPPIPAPGRLDGDGPHFEADDLASPAASPPLPPSAPHLGDPAGPQELSVIMDEPEEEGYRADPGKVQTTYMLALALGALTLLCAAPALRHPNLVEAPNWARVVLIASAVQLVFICWMVSLPDWSTVWINMVVFAFVAALYGVAWAVITFTPEYMPINFLDLDEPPDAPVRTRAGPWSFVMLMLATLLTYACGRFSGRWRRQYEMAKAMRE